jgi:hypothetical protein
MLLPDHHQVDALEKGGPLLCSPIAFHNWSCLLNELRHLEHVIQPVVNLKAVSLDLDPLLPPLPAGLGRLLTQHAFSLCVSAQRRLVAALRLPGVADLEIEAGLPDLLTLRHPGESKLVGPPCLPKLPGQGQNITHSLVQASGGLTPDFPGFPLRG